MTIRELINSDLTIGGDIRISDYETLNPITDLVTGLGEIRFFHSDLLDREIVAICPQPNPLIQQYSDAYYINPCFTDILVR